jgi:hypothetical protein
MKAPPQQFALVGGHARAIVFHAQFGAALPHAGEP